MKSWRYEYISVIAPQASFEMFFSIQPEADREHQAYFRYVWNGNPSVLLSSNTGCRTTISFHTPFLSFVLNFNTLDAAENSVAYAEN